TSVHWHGIALRNDMDGAPPATPDIPAGQDFTYRFSVPNSGTYWAHPHTGLDADTGLYLPVIVDDPTEGNYDAEWVVVLDDWTDGIGKSPQQLFRELSSPNKPAPPSEPASTTTPPTASTTTTTTTTGETSTTTSSTETSATSTSPTSSGSPTAAATGGPAGRSDLLGG
ncbi:multicopper oxidase domain-containing protein, partial [Mycobacterium kansasii]